ncbi:MAG: vitamin K epoxide reductase family protein [Desulfuromonadales bacterium]
MNPAQLSRELREGHDPLLDNRRKMVGLALTAMGCMGLISLYQMGIVNHLPDPPLPGINSDKVDASAEAYERLQMGDAFIGMVSYAGTAALAAMGGRKRARKQPWIPLAMAAKAGFDALPAARLTYDQYAKHRAACIWCLIASAATFATAALALPESRMAVRHLRGR